MSTTTQVRRRSTRSTSRSAVPDPPSPPTGADQTPARRGQKRMSVPTPRNEGASESSAVSTPAAVTAKKSRGQTPAKSISKPATSTQGSPEPAKVDRAQAPGPPPNTTTKKTPVIKATKAGAASRTLPHLEQAEAPPPPVKKPVKETKAAITKQAKKDIKKSAEKLWEIMEEKDRAVVATREVKSIRHLDDNREEADKESGSRESEGERSHSASGEDSDLDDGPRKSTNLEVEAEMEALQARLQHLKSLKEENCSSPSSESRATNGGVKSIGGLTEDDIADDRPSPGHAYFDSVPVLASTSTSKLKQPTVKKATLQPHKTATSESRPAPVEKGKGKSKKATKVEPRSQVRSKLTANDVRKSDLPDFTQASNKWAEIYLPTVYYMFYHASDHFATWSSSSKTLNEVVQTAVDLVYPEEGYQVGVLMTYNRLGERWSGLASEAIIILQEHLEKINDSVRINKGMSEAHDWLEWARRSTGPLYFENPTPAHCIAEVGEPGFITPSGRLRSQFLAKLIRDAFSYTTGTLYVVDTPPIGLFALALVALERAAEWLQPDGSIGKGVKPFSWTGPSGSAYMEYKLGLTQDIDDDQWAAVMSVMTHSLPEARPHAHKCASLFNFTSPSKRT
ncbi:hypothetical protein FA13DRAFT_1737657 [Coprinellus micaceus]|uniref:Uncharacterized protein n=1 Tax=Coprinellus micaceus TaxID=71717 RepID=A0A4Y7SWJ9_COPMI|nr:hypothetical protein FA13DRAFT_1737657 [Coprinellus micaceus]